MGQSAATPGNRGDGTGQGAARHVWRFPLQAWRRLTGAWRQAGQPRPRGPARDNAELTTLPPPGRGQALREAHRTLRQRMRSHPVLRQVMPHLYYIERALAKRGSVALLRVPVPVLHRGLLQLAQLQHDNEPPLEALNLRVLRLRLIEAIAVRAEALPPDHAGSARPDPQRTDVGATLNPVQTTQIPASSSLPGVEVRELPASAFDGNAPARHHDARQRPRH